ncbi:MAG: hypothetical protein KDI28_03450 [Pseudomonadales bacterium]|nr:hypothetical protein [Pseudomonadales bacterium]MCP5356611.1 hypothetical protein [Pseudomonadales bacterium]
MIKHFSLAACLLSLLLSCSQAPRHPLPDLTPAQTERIGDLIFANECNLKIPCLTSWNAGEDFPSLGIGHFIWYRQNQQEAFVESFPALLDYYDTRHVAIPAWISSLPERDSPWQTREAFLADTDGERLRELREFLYSTRDVQVDFIIERMQKSLPRLLTETKNPKEIQSLFYEVASSEPPLGMYALIDYVNFKGEGVSLSERYQGEGWGLLQVLETLQQNRSNAPVMMQFAQAAREVLARRVRNAPPERDEQRWLAGWNKRTETYENLP